MCQEARSEKLCGCFALLAFLSHVFRVSLVLLDWWLGFESHVFVEGWEKLSLEHHQATEGSDPLVAEGAEKGSQSPNSDGKGLPAPHAFLATSEKAPAIL